MTASPEPAAAPRRRFLDGGAADRPALAAALMVGSLGMLGLQDAIVKIASEAVSLWQFQALRAGMNLGLLMLLSRVLWGERVPRIVSLPAVALRSALLVGAMLLFFGGIPYLALNQVAAGLYVFPLFVAALSHLLLGERVGPRRAGAIAAGFLGALLLLQPWRADFSAVQLMPVGAALCYAGVILTTRKLCRAESPVGLAYGVSVAFLIVGLGGVLWLTAAPSPRAEAWPYLFGGWRPLALWALAAVAACSLLNLTANIGLARAYQTAESSWLAPFDYSYLLFATFWGWMIFGDLPNGLGTLGMALIAGSGLYVAWRERRSARG